MDDRFAGVRSCICSIRVRIAVTTNWPPARIPLRAPCNRGAVGIARTSASECAPVPYDLLKPRNKRMQHSWRVPVHTGILASISVSGQYRGDRFGTRVFVSGVQTLEKVAAKQALAERAGIRGSPAPARDSNGATS